MAERMKTTEAEFIDIEPRFWMRNQREIIARELNGDAAVLTEAELQDATLARLLKLAEGVLTKCGAQGVKSMSMCIMKDDPDRTRLAITLTNGYTVMTPGHVKSYV